MKKIITLIASIALSFSLSAAEPNYDFGYLTVAAYKQLTENEQRVVVVAAREATVFSLHNVEIHWLDKCVAELTNEDLQVAVNTVVAESQDQQASFVGTFVLLIGQICIAVQEQQEPQPEGFQFQVPPPTTII